MRGDTIKVVNVLDLAREITGDGSEPKPAEPRSGSTAPGEFWQARLAGWSGPTPLVVTIPGPQGGTTETGVLKERFSEVLVNRIVRLGSELRVPVPVIFSASWALLLHRYSGEEDIVAGLIKGCIAGEPTPVPHIVPMRVPVQPDMSVRLWLQQTAERSREAAPYEFSSLPQIKVAAGIASETALFYSVLSIGNDFDPATIAGSGPEQYPLVAAVDSDMTVRIAYAKPRFSEQAIELLCGHWMMLLEGIATGPESSLAALPMTTSEEARQLTTDWNSTSAPYPAQLCVHDLFEAQVERTPDAVAVIFGERQLTYRELNQRANTLAVYLREIGFHTDSVAGICMERSIEAVTAVLAVLKAGGAYLPLDPAYPHERLSFMLADSRAHVLITQESLRNLFDTPPQNVLCLSADWFNGRQKPAANLRLPSAPENLAYLIYTSGSTGKPKGVAMVHRALVNLVDWQIKDSRVGCGDRTLQFTSLSFDVSFQEMFGTWCSGGTLVLITAELRLSPRDLWQFIATERVARIFLPFVALQQLAEAFAQEQTPAPALREVITAGEQLQVTPRLRELFSKHPRATLHNHYGPSETHVVTALTLRGNPQEWPSLPTIGRPIQNATVYLLDKHLNPVPQGIPGELYIGGDALARGYFERPDVTAERFVRNPFIEPRTVGGRLYRTGDLARYLPDGDIEFLGRMDHQVKIRGYRIELGEVETALGRVEGVRECVVTAREAQPGLKQLVAYVVPKPEAVLSGQGVRQILKEALPEYMVPSHVVFLERLPLTPSGKVDRRSLPAPVETAAPSASAAGEKPWLPLQLQLVQIWEELLGVRPIGLRDNFFDLGGHSLLAVRMMDRVEEITGRKLPVTELFNNATIAHLTDLILKEEEHAASPVVELRSSGSRPPIYFLHGDVIGGGFYARDLARLTGEDQPFYVLPPAGMETGRLATVEELTAIHLRDLRAHRPHGPYILGGFCIGALIAYEMAVRLHAEGEEVPWVALIDPQLPSRFLRSHYLLTRRLAAKRGYSDEQTLSVFAKGHKVLYRLREEWHAPTREKLDFAARKLNGLLHRGKRNGEAAAPAEETKPQTNGDGLFQDREQRTLAAFHWILSGYTPPRYGGEVSVFITDEQLELTPFLAKRWAAAAPQARMVRVAGKHLGAITTDVESFAEKLRGELEQAVTGVHV